MRDLKKKHQLKRIAYSPVVALMLILVAVTVWRGVWDVYGRADKARSERNILAREVEELEQRQATLYHSIEYLNTQKGQEEEIRRKFNVAKDGERVIVFLERDEPQQESLSEERSVFGDVWAAVAGFFF